ncbi:MAG: oxygenase MpaB family protein [Acidimicrobiales bacterium]
MAPDPIQSLRSGIQHSLRRMVSADREPRDLSDRADDGLFGPTSATWVVHSDPSMFVGGLRALFLQTLHPHVMAGVYDHSTYKSDPLGRLQRTAEFVGTTTYGSVAEAEAIIDRIAALHQRVQGVAPDGASYDATDPHLLEWVHLTEVDSFLRAHQRYGSTPLGAADADRYVAEMAQVADRLGTGDTARSVAELKARLQVFRPELATNAQAHDTVRFLLRPMLELPPMGMAYASVCGAAVGLLPRFARRMLWLPLAPGVEPLLVRPAALVLLRTLGWAVEAPPEIDTAREQARVRAGRAAG